MQCTYLAYVYVPDVYRQYLCTLNNKYLYIYIYIHRDERCKIARWHKVPIGY